MEAGKVGEWHAPSLKALVMTVTIFSYVCLCFVNFLLDYLSIFHDNPIV